MLGFYSFMFVRYMLCFDFYLVYVGVLIVVVGFERLKKGSLTKILLLKDRVLVKIWVEVMHPKLRVQLVMIM